MTAHRKLESLATAGYVRKTKVAGRAVWMPTDDTPTFDETGDLLDDKDDGTEGDANESETEGETDTGSEAEREEHGDRRGRHGEHDAAADDDDRSWREDRLADGGTE